MRSLLAILNGGDGQSFNLLTRHLRAVACIMHMIYHAYDTCYCTEFRIQKCYFLIRTKDEEL